MSPSIQTIPDGPPPTYGSWLRPDDSRVSDTTDTSPATDVPEHDAPKYCTIGSGRRVYESMVGIPQLQQYGAASEPGVIHLSMENPIISTHCTTRTARWKETHLDVEATYIPPSVSSPFDEVLTLSALKQRSPLYTPSKDLPSRSNTGTLASKIPGSAAAREFLFGFKGDDLSVVSLFSSNYRPPQPSGLSVAMSSAYTGVSSVMTPIASVISGVASSVYNAPSALGSYISSMAPWPSPSNEAGGQRPLSAKPWSFDTGFESGETSSRNHTPSFVIVTPS